MKVILTLLLIAFSKVAALDKVVCSYQSWSVNDGIYPEDLDVSLCTHLIYAFLDVDWDGTLSNLNYDIDFDQKLLQRTAALKEQNPNLKILASLGGPLVEARKLSEVAGNSVRRSILVESATYFLQATKFDGLDINWEVPEKQDFGNYITLLTDLRFEFRKWGFLLTATVSSNVGIGYDVVKMNGILDFINVRSFDYYGYWSKYTGQNAALFASSVEDSWEKKYLNLAVSGQEWRDTGASPEKIVMGVATYGRSFTLKNSSDVGIHAPISGTGPGEGGYVPYSQICGEFDSWERIWDDEQKTPIKVNGDQWIGYDDVESLNAKMEYIISKNYSGVMVWSVNADDVHGKCGEKQVLLKSINKYL